MQVDRATFHATPVFFSRTYCSLCRTTHEWFAKDAWVCDSGTADCEQNYGAKSPSPVHLEAIYSSLLPHFEIYRSRDVGTAKPAQVR